MNVLMDTSKQGEQNLLPPRCQMILAEKRSATLQRENLFSSYMFPTNETVKHSLNGPFWGGKETTKQPCIFVPAPLLSVTQRWPPWHRFVSCVPLISAFPLQRLTLLNCSHTDQMTGKPLVGGGWDGLWLFEEGTVGSRLAEKRVWSCRRWNLLLFWSLDCV